MHVDLKILNKLYEFGMLESFPQLVDLFLEEAAASLDAMAVAVDEGNSDALHAAAHMLKSSGAQLGMT